MRRAVPPIDARLIDKTTLARLDIIAMLAFPDGSIGVSALRSEARRGRLEIWRVAGKDMTTLAEVERMVERCRVKQAPSASGSSQPKMIDLPSGLSRMDESESALAAALQIAEALSSGSLSTSPARGTRPASRNVVPMTRR